MAKFHLIPIVLGAAIGVGVYVVSKYLAQDEESEQIVDDSAFDDSEASESTEDADETEENADEEPPAEEPAAEPAPIEEPAPAEQAPVAEPAAPVEEPAQEDDGVTIPVQSGNDVPNVNPVQEKPEPVKLTEDGKVDPTPIAKAEDFGDWEEETGCRG